MVQATAAIADFMMILVTSALWVGAGFMGLGLACCGALGGVYACVRRWRR